ncbi:hypothetical protein HYH02_002489 [Chlamydomonas schloesseri]|uniref:Protein kinase domain-containing protein n=1 Tax=Chlamydomonas schloesseri TaxID=2026947 RepID=A0A835WS45_9CHLO|nr:hypothetical protein HYH02_002489 [Chlamydomonas schloesseri]|eukprot:KAG2453164.1 hypothetical protein HYH02_002489 [Chlamydomonas schloesseri]
MQDLVFTLENWPDPVQISHSVTLYSPYRVALDFCGGGQPARVLFNVTSSGSLLLLRVFVRNFLPAKPQDLTGLGPVPALLSSGGRITINLGIFHMGPETVWALNAPASQSFWAQQRRSAGAITDVYSGQPLQLSTPALYLLKYSAADYALITSYVALDLRGCFSGSPTDVVLVVCLYTFADALRNPNARTAMVFHDVGLDRSVYNPRNPVTISTPTTFKACPGSHPSINLDFISTGIVVRTKVEFRGIRFRGVQSTNFTSWPPGISLLLCTFDVFDGGMVSLVNSTVEVQNLPGAVRILKALPAGTTMDASRPNLQPSVTAWPSSSELARAQTMLSNPRTVADGGSVLTAWSDKPVLVVAAAGSAAVAASGLTATSAAPTTSPPGFDVSQWLLTMNAWTQYASGNVDAGFTGSEPSSAAWSFDHVHVEQADVANLNTLCFSAPLEQGIIFRSQVAVVATDAQLRAALARAARYIQVVADIKFDPANWPTGDNALLVEAGIIEVRGCHPTAGQRYTVDLSNLRGVVRVAGRLIVEGDLRFTNLGWRTLPASDVLAVASGAVDLPILGAFQLVPNRAGTFGGLDMERVLLEELLDSTSAGLRPSDMLTVLHLTHLTPALRLRNATLLPDDGGVVMGVWAVQEDAGFAWTFVASKVQWTPQTADTDMWDLALPPDSSSGSVPVAAIAVPAAVGGALLVAVVVLTVLFVRLRHSKRSSRNHAADGEAKGPGGDRAAGEAGTCLRGHKDKGKDEAASGSSAGSDTINTAPGSPRGAAACVGGSGYGSGAAGGGSSPAAVGMFAAAAGGYAGGTAAAPAAGRPPSGSRSMSELSLAVTNGWGPGPGVGLAVSAAAVAATRAGEGTDGRRMSNVQEASSVVPPAKQLTLGSTRAGVGAGGTGPGMASAPVNAIFGAKLGLSAGTSARGGVTSATQDAAVLMLANTSSGGPRDRAAATPGPLEGIDAAKRAIQAGRPVLTTERNSLDDLELVSVLGEGSYGRVYRALWRGTTVAVKVILLPAHMSGRERHERMAVMEAAISSSLSHPNVVQTYTYTVEEVQGAKARAAAAKRLKTLLGSETGGPDELQGSGMSTGGPNPGLSGIQLGGDSATAAHTADTPAHHEQDLIGYEIRLVQEFCDQGSLRDKLNAKAFFKRVLAPGLQTATAVNSGATGGNLVAPSINTALAAGMALAQASRSYANGQAVVVAAAAGNTTTPGAVEPGVLMTGPQPGSLWAGPTTVPGAAAAPAAAGPCSGGPASFNAGGMQRPGSMPQMQAMAMAAAGATGSLQPRAPSMQQIQMRPAASSNLDVSVGAAAGSSSLSQTTPLVVDLAAVLDTAIDIARAVAHLHREGIVHADLKPRNVLLKGSTHDPRGFVAKVADFGLSMRLDKDETHVSNAFHGTLAYMAPETLLNGHVSRASDVYSFGILLYELYSGETAYKDVPKALLGHAITKDNLRPVFPPALGAPFEYQLLACRCWESNPEIRPEFDFIVDELKRLRCRMVAPVDDGTTGGAWNSMCPGAGAGLAPGTFGLPEQWAAPASSRLPATAGITGGCLLQSSSQSCSSSGSGRGLHSGSGGEEDGEEDEEDGSVTMSAAASVVVNAGPTPNCSGGGPAHAAIATVVLANANMAVPNWGDVRDRRQVPGASSGGLPGSSSLSVTIGAPTFAPSTLRRNTSPRHQHPHPQQQQAPQYPGSALGGSQLLGAAGAGHASGANSHQASRPVEFAVVAEETVEETPRSL